MASRSRIGERSRNSARAAAARVGDARRRTMARVREVSRAARDSIKNREGYPPHLCFVAGPVVPMKLDAMGSEIRVASYNVHRWTGLSGRARPDAARAGFVINEIGADILALQEVLRPFDGEDPLAVLCDQLGLHLAFAATRLHRLGQLGNAILSRFPITGISVLDISYSRIERRGALAATISAADGQLGIVATHLSLVDKTRHRQVQSLLEHPHMNSGPAVLMGDMNAWRKCKGSQRLDDTLRRHHNVDWPATFPAARPVFALDRIYARGAEIVALEQHSTPAARRASDHLPIIAHIQVKDAPA